MADKFSPEAEKEINLMHIYKLVTAVINIIGLLSLCMPTQEINKNKNAHNGQLEMFPLIVG